MSDDIQLMLEREFGAPEYVSAIGVGFGLVPVEDGPASTKAGHPVYKEIEFCKKVVPGDNKSVACQPATDKDRQQFPRSYQAFKDRNIKPVDGLPVEQWPVINRAQAMTLKAIHIHTVEALAEGHDGNIGALGQGGRELVAKAKAYKEQAKDGAAAAAYAAENQALKDQMAEMQRQFLDLSARMEEEPRRGPGRPRKDAVA